MRRIEARLQTIPAEPRPLSDYYDLAPGDQLGRAASLAEPLAGARVLHVSAAPPEPADLGRPLVALLRDLGLEAEWAVVHGDSGFQRAARETSDAARGAPARTDEDEWHRLREACEAAAIAADLRRYDAVLAHGPGAAALIEGRRGGSTAWVWGTGLDLSSPDPATWPALRALLGDYTQLSFALPGFVPDGLDGLDVRVVPPAFDPFAPAQVIPSVQELSRRIRALGIDPTRPLVADVTRLDRWADPLATIEAWRRARAEVGGLQLALTGRLDRGDREAVTVMDEVRAFAGEERDLFVLADGRAVDDRDRGALVRLARCATWDALGDEFDPALVAAQWCGTAVVAGGASAAAQIRDREGGFLAAEIEDRAARIAELASDPGRAVALGRAGREHARGHFLLTRLLGDELATLASLLGVASAAEEPSRVAV